MACRSVHVWGGRGRGDRGGKEGKGGERGYLCNHFSDPVHLVPQLAAGGGEADEGLLQGHAGVVGPLLHDLAQPHHLHLLGLELQLGRHRLLGVQHLLGGEQRQEEGAVACTKAATWWGSDNKQAPPQTYAVIP